VLFVTELLQSLGNGRGKRKESRDEIEAGSVRSTSGDSRRPSPRLLARRVGAKYCCANSRALYLGCFPQRSDRHLATRPAVFAACQPLHFRGGLHRDEKTILSYELVFHEAVEAPGTTA